MAYPHPTLGYNQRMQQQRDEEEQAANNPPQSQPAAPTPPAPQGESIAGLVNSIGQPENPPSTSVASYP